MNIIKQLKRDLVDNYSTDDIVAMARLHKLNVAETSLDVLIDRIARANFKRINAVNGKMKKGNILQELLLEYPDGYDKNYRRKTWDFTQLSRNPNITPEFMEGHPEFPWSWRDVSANPNITMEYIERHPEKDWNWHVMSRNPNLTMKFIKKHLDKDWIWDFISFNENINIGDIEENLDLPWDWCAMSRNPNLTMKFIKKHLDKDWSWDYISSNKNISMSDIEENLDLPWDWEFVSYNPNIDMKFVKKYLDKGLELNSISNKNITLDDIKDGDGRLTDISSNPNINIDFIKDNLDTYQNWNWYALSQHPAISMDDITNNPDLPWKWDSVLSNPNITAEFIEKKLDKLLRWIDLSENPGITKDIIVKNIDKIYFNMLSSNTFNIDVKQERTEKATTRIMRPKDDEQEDNRKQQLNILWGDLCKELYTSKKLSELRGMAKAMGIKGYQRKNKKELCADIGAQVIIYNKDLAALGALQD